MAAKYKTLDDLSSKYAEYKKAGRGIKKVLTGIMPLDYLTAGGIPLGRIIEMYGAFSSGKSTTSFYIMREFMKQMPNKSIMLVDVEGSFEEDWAIRNGLDPYQDNFRITTGTTGEDIMEKMEFAIRTGELSMVVLDSLGAMYFEEEQTYVTSSDDVTTKEKIGTMPKKFGVWLKKMSPVLQECETTFIILNQIRANIDPYAGAKINAPGGAQKDHQTTIKLISKSSKISVGTGKEKEDVGIITNIKCHKNKVGMAGRVGNIYIYGHSGIDLIETNVNFLSYHGFIKRSGPMYYVGEDKYKGLQALREGMSNIDWTSYYKDTDFAAFISGRKQIDISNVEITPDTEEDFGSSEE